MTGVTIEPTSDTRLLAQIHAETVIFAYAPFFPPDSDPPGVEEFADAWGSRLADPSAHALLAWREGTAVGSVMTRRDPDFGAEGQVVGLHVLPTHWGHGVGGALHDAAIARLVEDGYRVAGLWVIAANERARSMYTSRGWQIVPGAQLDYLGVTEVRYRRSIQ